MRDPGRRAGHRGRGQRVDRMSGIILEPVDWDNMPPRQPHAQTVANLEAILAGAYRAGGRAYWLQAAGQMVCWVIVCHVGAQTLQVYGAGGPAWTLQTAHQIGMDGLRAALDQLTHSSQLAYAIHAARVTNGGAG
jgi:hypothetical protein